MNDNYIMPEWLEAVRGTTFFYPCAYEDHAEPLAVFGDIIDEFWFGDTNYCADLNMTSALNGRSGHRLVSCEKSGSLNKKIENRTDDDGRPYRYLLPSKRIETYERTDGRRLTVIRRRGFGQMALTNEFQQRSIGVFMHRGDSAGESGSNVYFLANLPSRYEPCARLFEKLSWCLTDKALIISDGSNACIRNVRKFHDSNLDGCEVFERLREVNFTFGQFRWSCVGWLGRRYGPTLVWGLTRISVHGNEIVGSVPNATMKTQSAASSSFSSSSDPVRN